MFNFFKKAPEKAKVPVNRQSKNPHLTHKRSFNSSNLEMLLSGWTTQTSSIDWYLRNELRPLRARSREIVRQNPHAKRFINIMKTNIVGQKGVSVQAQTKLFRNGKFMLDRVANDALEKHFKDWSRCQNCDYLGKINFLSMQKKAISSLCQDGEFIFRKHYGKSAGKYGFSLEFIDAELLDADKNEQTVAGGEIRLGVEYNKRGKVVRYHFRDRALHGITYKAGQGYSVDAKYIIHGFIDDEHADQSRGVPLFAPSLYRLKNTDKYDESAMAAARVGAAKTMFLRSDEDQEAWTGDTEGTGAYEGMTVDDMSLGPLEINDIGNRKIESFDPAYPTELYNTFTEANLQAIASGLNISYHTLASNLKGVNYTSSRTGALEDREYYKALQDWLIDTLIRPVYEEFVTYGILYDAIKINQTVSMTRPVEQYLPAKYQGKRWDWVDPLKDVSAIEKYIALNLKSRTQIASEMGQDLEETMIQIQAEKERMKELGLKTETENEGGQEDADEEG